MNLRTYLLLLVGVLNSLLVIHLITTPLIPTDERPWYPSTPHGAREYLDPAMGALLPSTTSLPCAPTGQWWAFALWRPSAEQIAALETDLSWFAASVDSLNEHGYWNDHPALAKYHRQYLGIQVLGGPRIIFVNAFLEDHSPDPQNWRRRMVCVDDGGTGYWHVQYDPVDRRFRRFGFNGVG